MGEFKKQKKEAVVQHSHVSGICFHSKSTVGPLLESLYPDLTFEDSFKVSSESAEEVGVKSAEVDGIY